jgi:hypothetical protein
MLRRLRRLATVTLLTCAACTVDVGVPPGADAGACAASPDYFVSAVYPDYLAANLCGSSGCHDFADGHGYLRLRQPEAPPAAGTPLAAWPLGWRENYLSALQLVRCDDPLASRILTVPEGQSNLHPPGPVVLDRATAATVIETWVRP